MHKKCGVAVELSHPKGHGAFSISSRKRASLQLVRTKGFAALWFVLAAAEHPCQLRRTYCTSSETSLMHKHTDNRRVTLGPVMLCCVCVAPKDNKDEAVMQAAKKKDMKRWIWLCFLKCHPDLDLFIEVPAPCWCQTLFWSVSQLTKMLRETDTQKLES